MDDLVDWIKDERVRMEKQVTILKDNGGKLKSNKGDGRGWVDITQDWIIELERRIAEGDRLLAKIAERQ